VVNAAARAGASQLPEGESVSEEASIQYAQDNPVMGQVIDPSELNFVYDGSTFQVSATTQVPTVMAKLLCGMSASLGGGGGFDYEGEGGSESGVGGDGSGVDSASGASCDMMTVGAEAKAVPAARDVILVIDTSGSMNKGNGQPFGDVKEAAHAYIDKVIELDSESVDRIGIVTFDFNGRVNIGLTSTYDSNGFQTVHDAIDNLDLYSGSEWWNTNYYAGLKNALNEMENRGRKNASKTIVFLTDGYPNVPDGPNWNYKTCINEYNRGQQFRSWANYYYAHGHFSYGNYYYNLSEQKYDYAYACTSGYTDHMIQVTEGQTQRALDNEVTIHTIQIGPPPEQSNSLVSIRRMLDDQYWHPELLDYMALTTDGEQYASINNDSPGRIEEIYQAIAQDVHMRLAQ
jgi:hypothetical protein